MEEQSEKLQQRCPACGSPHDSTAQFCAFCGTKLTTPSLALVPGTTPLPPEKLDSPVILPNPRPSGPLRRLTSGRFPWLIAVVLLILAALASAFFWLPGLLQLDSVSLDDPLTTNVHHWATNANCTFQNHALVVTALHRYQLCLAPLPSLARVQVTVTVRQIPITGVTLKKGAFICGYGFGIVIRATGQNGYVLLINNRGIYRFDTAIHGILQRPPLVPPTPSKALHIGPNAANTLSIAAHDNDFILSLNGTPVREIHNAQLQSGQVGLLVVAPCAAAFSNLTVSGR